MSVHTPGAVLPTLFGLPPLLLLEQPPDHAETSRTPSTDTANQAAFEKFIEVPFQA